MNLRLINHLREYFKEEAELSKEDFDQSTNCLHSQFDKFVMALGIYLDFFVNQMNQERTLPSVIKDLMKSPETVINHVICFNYIDHISPLLQTFIHVPDDFVSMIHGQVNYCNYIDDDIESIIKNNSMIIGFEKDAGNHNDNFNDYLKAPQCYHKETDSRYVDWLKMMDCTNAQNHIYIFGHSLGATDRSFFRSLFARNVRTTIFYHNESEDKGKEAKQKLKKALEKILTPEMLAEKTQGTEPMITFLPDRV